MHTNLVLGINNLASVLGPMIGGFLVLGMMLVLAVLVWRSVE